jgi:hypothetical protein
MIATRNDPARPWGPLQGKRTRSERSEVLFSCERAVGAECVALRGRHLLKLSYDKQENSAAKSSVHSAYVIRMVNRLPAIGGCRSGGSARWCCGSGAIRLARATSPCARRLLPDDLDVLTSRLPPAFPLLEGISYPWGHFFFQLYLDHEAAMRTIPGRRRRGRSADSGGPSVAAPQSPATPCAPPAASRSEQACDSIRPGR